MELGNDTQARYLAQKKREAEAEEQRLQLELNRVTRDRKEAISAEQEKKDNELVEISERATGQMEAIKRQNSDRIKALNLKNQQDFEVLATKTADDLKRIDTDAFNTIQTHRLDTMERIRNVTSRSEDPFYRLKSLNPLVGENAKEYTIQVKLPKHEAEHVFVAGEGPAVKVSLARRFEENVKSPEGNRATKTSSYQSVTEQVHIPGPYDVRKISQEYQDGILTIRLPKTNFGEAQSN